MAATMKQKSNGLVDGPTNGHLQGYKFLTHVYSLPVVHDLTDELQKYSLAVKAQGAIKQVSDSAYKLAGPIEPYLERADGYADAGLRNLESRFPIVKAPTSEVIEKTKQPAVIAKTTVDTYVGAAKEKWNGTAKSVSDKANGKILGLNQNGEMAEAKEKVEHVLKPVLDKVETILDNYLPNSDQVRNSFDTKKPDNQTERFLALSSGMVDRSKEGVTRSLNLGRQTAATMADTANWMVFHPLQVPGAAIGIMVRCVRTIQAGAKETVQSARYLTSGSVGLVTKARNEATRIYRDETDKAPKSQPTGILTASFNTALSLKNELVGYAWSFVEQKKEQLKQTANGSNGSLKDPKTETGHTFGTYIRLDGNGPDLDALVADADASLQPAIPYSETHLPRGQLHIGESFADAVQLQVARPTT